MRKIIWMGATLLLAAASTVSAQKADDLQALHDTGRILVEDKAVGLNATDRQVLRDDYEALSDALGGLDPYGLLARGGFIQASRAAPTAPPDVTTTTQSFSISPGAAIPDGPGGNLSSDLAVGGAGATIWDVDVTIDITHTWASDLEITLTSPSGTVTTLTTDNGGGNDDVWSGTLFDDQAGTPVTQYAYANGVTATPVVPEGALGTFFQEDPNGTWTLSITDDAGLDTGTLNSWSLAITTLDGPVLLGGGSGSNAPAAAIPDGPGGNLVDTLQVTGLDTFICGVNATVDITHTWNDDLDIVLVSPAGTSVPLSLQNGGSNDDVFSGSLFDDSASTPVTDFVYSNGVTATPLVPEGALAAFAGEDPNGTWQLDITDNAGFDTGTLNSWSVDVTTCRGIPALPVPATSGWSLFVLLLAVLGLGGVAVRRFA